MSVRANRMQAGNSVRVALHDSPDKQLAQKLHGRSLALELVFRRPRAAAEHAAPPPAAHRSSARVSWGAAMAALVVCALIAFAATYLAPRGLKAKGEA